MADKAHNETDGILADMEAHLAEIYEQAGKEIEAKADEYFSQFERLDAQKKKQVEDGRISEDEYIRWRKNKILYGKHWTQLKEKIAAEYANVNRIALSYINGRLPKIYALNYNAIGKDIGSAVKGYSFELINADLVKNLATKDDTLLPYKYLDGKKDVRWNTKKVNSAVLQGILQGESIPKMSKRLQSVTGMNKTAAIRNARTCVTGAECKARQDGFERAAADGIELQREWIAAIDGRTRHAHRLLDGQLAGVDEPFKSELGDIMFPGDPEARPENVYNCRCTIAAKVISIGVVKINEKEPKKNIIKSPEAYNDVDSIDRRLDELKKEMDSSNNFSRWVEIEKEQNDLEERKRLLLRKESRQRAKEIQQRIYEKDYFATKGIGKGYAIDLDGLDEKSMLDVENALDSLFDKFPSLKKKFPGISVSDDLPEGAMAACGTDFGEISLSKAYFANNSKIASAWRKCVENGFHPKGTSNHASIVHEFGHSIDHLLTRKGDIFDPKYIGKDATASTTIKKRVFKKLGIVDDDVAAGLSSYATMNDKEFVAEAFAEYVTSPTPRPIAVAVGEEIKKMLGGLL